MKKTLFALAIATLAATGLSAPASAANGKSAVQAQAVQVEFVKREHRNRGDFRRGGVSQRDIYRSLYRMGFRDIGPLYRKHGAYITTARGYRGQVRLVVDARSGRLISRKVIGGHSYRWDHNRRYGHTYGGSKGGFSWSLQIR